jgi:hypothetical protein
MISASEVGYSKEQVRWVEESIRIRRAAEPVELLEAVYMFNLQSFICLGSNF